VFSLGRGATLSYSRKVKTNTRSLTETELVTADMFMPEMLWSLHFIQAQGYDAECVGLYQDNISTQLLIKNGKLSSGKRTKHIKAKFFFIKDRVDDGEIRVVDCPTEEMWADIMTKPLQGTAFRVMRAELMNCDVNYEDLYKLISNICIFELRPDRLCNFEFTGLFTNITSEIWSFCNCHIRYYMVGPTRNFEVMGRFNHVISNIRRFYIRY
jgi:hypothetical protein